MAPRFTDHHRELGFAIQLLRELSIEPDRRVGPDDQSDVLTKNSGSLPDKGVLAFSLLWAR